MNLKVFQICIIKNHGHITYRPSFVCVCVCVCVRVCVCGGGYLLLVLKYWNCLQGLSKVVKGDKL
jgi:hypothetical protein